MESSPSDDEVVPSPGGMPLLEPWFAVIGASAGLFVMLGIGALRPHLHDGPILFTVLLSLTVGAAAGAILTRWPALHRPLASPEQRAIGTSLILAAGGALIGLLVGVASWGFVSLRATAGGAVLALLFVPSCLAIFEAAQRSRRARHGSIIAAADRRTIFATFFAALAATSLVAAPAFVTATSSSALHTPSQIAIAVLVALACTLGVGVSWLLDRRGMRELLTLAAQAEDLEPSTTGEAEDAKAIDLGLGDEAWAKRRAATYRTGARSQPLLRGSLNEALAAMRETSRRRLRACAVCVTAIAIALVGRALGDPHCSRCVSFGITGDGCAFADGVALELPALLGAPFRMERLTENAKTNLHGRSRWLAGAAVEAARPRETGKAMYRRNANWSDSIPDASSALSPWNSTSVEEVYFRQE